MAKKKSRKLRMETHTLAYQIVRVYILWWKEWRAFVCLCTFVFSLLYGWERGVLMALKRG